MAGKKENKPTGLGGPRGLLSLIYLPHFMKIHGLSDEDVAKARAGSVYQEIFRSVLISCLVTVVMMVYLIYGLLSGYFLSGSRDKAFLLTAILLMLGSGVTYLIYYLLTYKRSLGVIKREAIQFVYYLCIVASILLFHVATKTNPATAADFSLGYIWFLALAITPPTYIAYWLAISGLSLAGCIATISTLETVQTNATQCYIIVVSFIIVSYFIRSHDFISSYYKNRVQEENEENGHLAQTDQLTGIENRRALDEFVSTRSKGWEEKGSKVCILMFDIDFFKCYNDVLGHIQGDKCLKEVTAAVKEAAFD